MGLWQDLGFMVIMAEGVVITQGTPPNGTQAITKVHKPAYDWDCLGTIGEYSRR